MNPVSWLTNVFSQSAVFPDRGKTILPRLDTIFLQTRAIGVFLITLSVLSGDIPDTHRVTGIIIAIAVAIHLGLFYLLTRGKKLDTKVAYAVTIVFDIVMCYILMRISGGIGSFYFLGFYLVSSLASYALTPGFGAVVVVASTLAYVSAVWPDIRGWRDWYAVSALASFNFILFIAISYSVEHLRRTEARVLKLFDTLNQRTSEVEKIQTQLETIYDNSRILAGILDVDEVIKAVMQIINGVLKYPAAAVLLRTGRDGFLYRGRAIDGEINLRLKGITEGPVDLLAKVSRNGAPVRINDVRGNDEYTPLRSETRSVMLAPMTIRRKTIGVLVAESSTVGAYNERDEKMFWVVARSAAMALDNATAHRQLEELSVTDELTGLHNFRHFSEKLSEEQRRASRYNNPLSLIMLDLDHFKKFNDTYGHEIGNIVLKGVSQVLRGCVRDTDILARYGGEEFAVILPQTGSQEAGQIAERIRGTIDAQRFDIGEGQPRLQLTVSVGVTSFPENGRPHIELVQLADQALYRAKGSGRNAVAAL